MFCNKPSALFDVSRVFGEISSTPPGVNFFVRSSIPLNLVFNLFACAIASPILFLNFASSRMTSKCNSSIEPFAIVYCLLNSSSVINPSSPFAIRSLLRKDSIVFSMAGSFGLYLYSSAVTALFLPFLSRLYKV